MDGGLRAKSNAVDCGAGGAWIADGNCSVDGKHAWAAK
jgi:hypothetical protein